jgi:hypothetical protein
MHEHDTAPPTWLATPTERIHWWATHPEQLLAALAEGHATVGNQHVSVVVERPARPSS